MPIIADGLVDPSFPRTFILLHDASDAAAKLADAQASLAECARTFGAASCHLLTINSRTTEAPLPDLHSGLPEGSPLSVEDVERLRKLITGPLAESISASLQTLSLIHI